MSSLYEIAEQYKNIEQLLDDESISQEDVFNALATVEDSLQVKCENGIKLLVSIDDTIGNIKNRIKELKAYQSLLEHRKERVSNLYTNTLKSLSKDRVTTTEGEMKIRKNPPSVIVDDIALVPATYQRQKITIDIDKTALKKDLKAGKAIEGCHLEQTERLVY